MQPCIDIMEEDLITFHNESCIYDVCRADGDISLGKPHIPEGYTCMLTSSSHLVHRTMSFDYVEYVSI